MKKLLLLCIAAAGLCHAQDVLLSEINPSNFSRDFSEYNQQTALFCAQISEVAYWDRRNVEILKERSIKIIRKAKQTIP